MSYKENRQQPAVKTGAVNRDAPLKPSLSSQNIVLAPSTTVAVKAEPNDADRVPIERGLPVSSNISGNPSSGLSSQRARASGLPTAIKNEDVVMDNAPKPLAIPEDVKPRLYTVYNSATEISYLPEIALKEGICMVKEIKEGVKKLELGSKLRQDVWLREIESLQSQGAPTTLIAVCGATGAGKSSILNAILDDNIVPTSGMRACTAVVTEIAHHAKKTIDADVSFLSEGEWRQELDVLLQDLVDEDGNLKRSTDLNSDAGIAWQKVHAVYPTILQEQLVRMSVDQIIAKDQKIARILGTTKNIVASNSKVFAKEIAKYIDSKDQKRGKKDKKDKEKDKNKKKGDPNAPALWPLIRQVRVRCPSAALSTGAVLVDLPGVADANAARNNIAKSYMKKCDCIWILAPITRAVDDKTARDLLGEAFRTQLLNGNYDAHAITFIASKCDDISCSEVIAALHLDDDQLEEIETRIDHYADETKKAKKKKSDTEVAIKQIDAQLKESRNIYSEYEAHKTALENGEPFEPRLTGNATKALEKANGKKRKHSGSGGKKGSPKRRKSGPFDEDEEDDRSSDSDDDMESDVDSDSDGLESNAPSSNGSDGSDSDSSDEDSERHDEKSGSGSDSEDGAEAEEEVVTVESLTEKMEEMQQTIKAVRAHLTEVRKEKKDAVDTLATLKKNQGKAQREKNAFCSLKRSEFSRDVLKEDFRTGLKELDDAAAEERDPDNFDPSMNLRNYDEIDLPVFTCSARDYVRLTNQVKGDGDPSCFSNVKDTGIPELQQWCHSLTVSSRERAARNFLNHIQTFATSIQTYVQGIGDVTEADREALRRKWESSVTGAHDDEDAMDGHRWGGSYTFSSCDDDDEDDEGYLHSLTRGRTMKVDEYGEPIGVTPRLVTEFGKAVDDTVKELKDRFNVGLEAKCQIGAANAAEAAVETSDNFAASMHWGTYRATLRRHGTWRRDLNVELLAPFARNIATSWSKVFETNLFASFDKSAVAAINKVVKEVEESVPAGLKDRATVQMEVCLEEAKVTMHNIIEVVRESLTSEQKEISRRLAPHVQEQLSEGYDRAMEERGRGSVARQKLLFHDYINDCKDDVFEGGAEVILERLSKAAEAVGQALDNALESLAQKIEVSLAVLWEGPRDDPAQVRACNEVANSVSTIIHQIQLWKEADHQRMITSA